MHLRGGKSLCTWIQYYETFLTWFYSKKTKCCLILRSFLVHKKKLVKQLAVVEKNYFLLQNINRKAKPAKLQVSIWGTKSNHLIFWGGYFAQDAWVCVPDVVSMGSHGALQCHLVSHATFMFCKCCYVCADLRMVRPKPICDIHDFYRYVVCIYIVNSFSFMSGKTYFCRHQLLRVVRLECL